MPNSISIRKLRNIEHLDFDMPREGVWLLSGANGVGKTTLLACLRRIGDANAFPTHFPSSLQSDALDNFSSAKIIYRVDDEEVEYAYRGERWAPRPRRNSHLLQRFGYYTLIYIGATADRITPRPEDFDTRRVRRAPAQIIDAANSIFNTGKFNDLRTINLTRGAGNPAFVLRVKSPRGARNHYHSEKQFSLGELCILKLIKALDECADESLVLIDELEMALHPSVQIRLFEYLSEIAPRKRLTVIFSTHSVSLIKSVPRKKLIFLEFDEQGIAPIYGCFPSYAIGRLALGEERALDRVLYVEDDIARYIVEALVKLSLQRSFANQDSLFPLVKVVPIGDFTNVVKFLNQHDGMMPGDVRSYAVLDADVKDETLITWRDNDNHERLLCFQQLGDRIKYLPWTPEVGLIRFFQAGLQQAETRLRNHFGDRQIIIAPRLFDDIPIDPGRPQRQKCKQIFKSVRDDVCRITAQPQELVERGLCEVFARYHFEIDPAGTQQLLNPMLN